MTSPENVSVSITPEQRLPAGQEHSTISRLATFALTRYSANIEWAGFTALGQIAERRYGVNPLISVGAIAPTVTALEYAQSSWAVKRLDATTQSTEHIDHKTVKELTALGMASWQGAGANVEYNEAVGLPSTKKRRLGQSAVYGAFVGMWSSPLPPFSQARDAATDALIYSAERPVQALVVAAAGSTGVFLGLERFKKWRSSKQPQTSSEQ